MFLENKMIPENEMGVIVLFAQGLHETGDADIIRIGAAFPDATLAVKGDVYRAEFEYKASNFSDHKHDLRECDLIVCWENDFRDSVLPVIELQKENWIDDLYHVKLPSQQEREVAYWKRRAITAERRLRAQEPSGKKGTKPGRYECQYCGTPFLTQNACNAHSGRCSEKPEPQPVVSGNGHKAAEEKPLY